MIWKWLGSLMAARTQEPDRVPQVAPAKVSALATAPEVLEIAPSRHVLRVFIPISSRSFDTKACIGHNLLHLLWYKNSGQQLGPPIAVKPDQHLPSPKAARHHFPLIFPRVKYRPCCRGAALVIPFQATFKQCTCDGRRGRCRGRWL